MVKIYVGEGDENCWVLHEDVLCGRSDFFKMGFKGGFKEAHEKVMRLPEDDPVMFGYFVEVSKHPYHIFASCFFSIVSQNIDTIAKL